MIVLVFNDCSNIVVEDEKQKIPKEKSETTCEYIKPVCKGNYAQEHKRDLDLLHPLLLIISFILLTVLVFNEFSNIVLES